MPIPKQIAALSRFDAMKHLIFATGQLMFDETAEDHATLAAEYHEQYSPASAAQHLLVETLITNEWRLRRLRCIEARQWMYASFHFVALNLDTTITSTSGQAFATESSTFERFQLIVNSCERAYHRALKDWQLMQPKGGAGAVACQHASQPRPPLQKSSQPSHSKTTSARMASFRLNRSTNLLPPKAQPAAEPAQPPQPAHSKTGCTTPASFRKNPESQPVGPVPDPPPGSPGDSQSPRRVEDPREAA